MFINIWSNTRCLLKDGELQVDYYDFLIPAVGSRLKSRRTSAFMPGFPKAFGSPLPETGC